MDRRHLAASAAIFALLFVPVVFMLEMGIIAFSISLPPALALGVVVFLCVVIEEAAKSIMACVAAERGLVTRWKDVALLAVISATFFFLGEKTLLFLSLKVISESIFTSAVFASGALWIPLLVHSVCTLTVCLLAFRLGEKRYPLALLAGAVIHGLYNISLVGVFS
jgi:hypothetical protein